MTEALAQCRAPRCRCALPGLSLGGLVLDLPHYTVGTASTGRGGGERKWVEGGERGRETVGSRHKALIVELSKQTCV